MVFFASSRNGEKRWKCLHCSEANKEVLNKETGRIFRFAPEKSASREFPHRYADLAALADLQLAELHAVESGWHTGRARVELQHRATSRPIDSAAISLLRKQYATAAAPSARLTGCVPDADCLDG